MHIRILVGQQSIMYTIVFDFTGGFNLVADTDLSMSRWLRFVVLGFLAIYLGS